MSLTDYTCWDQCSCCISSPGPNQYLDTGSMGLIRPLRASCPPRFSSFSTARLALQLGTSLVGVKVRGRRRMSSSLDQIFLWVLSPDERRGAETNPAPGVGTGLTRQNKTRCGSVTSVFYSLGCRSHFSYRPVKIVLRKWLIRIHYFKLTYPSSKTVS